MSCAGIFHNAGAAQSPRVSRGYVLGDWLEHQLAARSPITALKEPSPDLEIITCHNSPEESVLERTARDCGVGPVTVLGRELKNWNFFVRHELILQHLEKGPEHGLCLVLDAFDVLVTVPPSELMRAYRDLGSPPVVFNGERRAMPNLKPLLAQRVDSPFLKRAADAVNWERRLPDARAPHLNAGCLMGDRCAIRKLLQQLLHLRKTMDSFYEEHLGWDDQQLMRILHHEHHPRVQVDTHERLFQCLQGLRGPGELRFQPVPGPFRFLWLLLTHRHTWSYPYWKLRRSVAAMRGRIPHP